MLFRNPPLFSFWRERLETPDSDFIDIDHTPFCAGIRSGCVTILSYGLEGNSTRRYTLGMAGALNHRGWDVMARNFRGCSGEMNHTLPLYHGGKTNDLRLIVHYCVSLGYGGVVLVGFSMGGNQTLKYLGERDRTIPSQVSAAVAVSVPCDMKGVAEVLSLPSRVPYMAYLPRALQQKVEEKHSRFPGRIDIDGLDRIRTFSEFDDRYTIPLRDFDSARHYWRESDCLRLLKHIDVPFLLINASDDPFLSPGCYPNHVAEVNTVMMLGMPPWGGHAGFVTSGRDLY